MYVRDAVEADAPALASLANAPTDVMRNLVHDRTVRVAESNGEDGADEIEPPSDERDLLGFVSFDASPDIVHVTQIDGTPDACRTLLAEPVGFANAESMPVELIVPADRDHVEEAAVALGFEPVGKGPRFGPLPTVRLRHSP